MCRGLSSFLLMARQVELGPYAGYLADDDLEGFAFFCSLRQIYGQKAGEGWVSKVCGMRREKSRPGLALSTMERLRWASLSLFDGVEPFCAGAGRKAISATRH